MSGTLTSDFGGKRTKRSAIEHLCKTCGRKFTIVRGKREEVLISSKLQERSLLALSKEIAKNASLKEKVRVLSEERRSAKTSLKRAKEGTYLRSLQSRLSELQGQVEFLKGEKAKLQKLLALT